VVIQSNNQFLIKGQLNHVQYIDGAELKIMQYGDLSSLVVEYPNYNSLGKSLMTLYKIGDGESILRSNKALNI